MDQTLAGYVRALRAAGADASTAEALDAARALTLVGYADRRLLKDSLGLVLAKSEAEKALHEQVFERYFKPAPSTGSSDAAAADAEAEATGDAEVDALLSLLAQGRGGPGTALSAALQRAAREAGVDDIRFAWQAPFLSRQLLDRLGQPALERLLLQRLGQGTAAATAQAARLSAARDALQRQARALVDQRYELFGRAATEGFMNEVVVQRALGRLGPADYPRMKTVVARMARRLAIKHAQRRRVLQHGRLDLRRTLRASAGHDGLPFELVFKHRRRDKPRLLVVCDVSSSVQAHVRFLLLFLYALQGTVTDLHTFAFSSRLKDVQPPLSRLPFDAAMDLILRDMGGGGTDYGRAWQDLSDRHGALVDRRTTVLVLGDGRSNGSDPRLDLFGELARRAKRLVWLCPEPPGRWGSGDSCMLQYRPLCTHVAHCATAADLERAIDEALEAYD